MPLGRRIVRTARAAAASCVLLTGCLATRTDLRVVQNDLAVMRAETVRADSARLSELTRVTGQLAIVAESLQATSARIGTFQADVKGNLYSVEQQLLQIQELGGQSQRRLVELRAEMEKRARAVARPVTDSGVGGVAAPAGPGPSELFQLSLDQLRRGSSGAARAGFLDLLARFPSSDLAPDALFYVAESLAADNNALAADSVYALVGLRHATSARAPTALYKRAVLLQAAGSTVAARAAFDEVVRAYPRSDEAALARDRLRTLR